MVDNEKLGTELAVAEEAGVEVTPNPVKEPAGVEDPALTADAIKVVAADEEPRANDGNVVEEDTEAEPPADGVDALVVVVTVESNGAADGAKEKDVAFAEGVVESGADDPKLKEDCEDEEDGVNEKVEAVVDVALGVKEGKLELEVGLAKENPVEAEKGDDVAAELEENMLENEGVVAEADEEAPDNIAVVAAAVVAAGKLELAEVAVVPNRGEAVDRPVPNNGEPEVAPEAAPPNKDATEAAAEDDDVPNGGEAAIVAKVDDDVDAAPNSGEFVLEDVPNRGAPEVAAPNKDEPELAADRGVANKDELELALEEGKGVPNREAAELADEPNNGEGEPDANGDGPELAAG